MMRGSVRSIFLVGPTGKQSGSITWGPEHLTRPGVSAEYLQELPIASVSLEACVASMLGCWCFSFDSCPGLGQSPSVTHAYWLFVDFGLFSSQTFFFQWISSCFSRYSTWMKKRRYCLKVSWTCSRSGTSCSRLGRGTLWRVCVPGVDCTDASEIPKQYRAWFVSITQELKKPVESGTKMSAGGATAVIQLEMDNTFGPVFLRSACFRVTVNSPVSSACGEQPLSV